MLSNPFYLLNGQNVSAIHFSRSHSISALLHPVLSVNERVAQVKVFRIPTIPMSNTLVQNPFVVWDWAVENFPRKAMCFPELALVANTSMFVSGAKQKATVLTNNGIGRKSFQRRVESRVWFPFNLNRGNVFALLAFGFHMMLLA